MKNCRVAYHRVNFALALTLQLSARRNEESKKTLAVTWSETPAISTPTNVIYILTDDQRFDEMGFITIIDTQYRSTRQ